MTEVRTPTLREVIARNVSPMLAGLHVSMPGLVEAYDAAAQTVEVVPLLMFPKTDAAGNVTLEAPPKLVGIPVLFMGGGGARMTFPVQPGDFVTLLCADRSIDVWKGNGSTAPVDPGVESSHDLADAVAIPGLRPLSSPWANAPTDRATMGYDTGERIEVLPGRINLGAGASQALVLGGQYQTHMGQAVTSAQALQTAITPLMLPPAAAAAKVAVGQLIVALQALQNDISSNSFTT